MSDAEVLLTISEGAKLLRVPESWIYDRTRRNAVPLVRLGKYVRLPKNALLRWAEAGCPARWNEKQENGRDD
jgi:excisionase family DNA binding protein